MMEDITMLEEHEITKILKNGEVLLDFYSEGCGPCKMMASVLEALTKDFPDVIFAKVDATKQSSLSEKFVVKSLPYFVFLRNGVVVGTKAGAAPKEVIKQFIDKAKEI